MSTAGQMIASNSAPNATLQLKKRRWVARLRGAGWAKCASGRHPEQSDQGDLKLQIAGLLADADAFVLRGDPKARAFSVFGFAGDKLRCVESVNRGGDHMAARRLISENISLSATQAGDISFDLKAYAMRRKLVA